MTSDSQGALDRQAGDAAPCFIVADLHLDGRREPRRRLGRLLETAARERVELHILGDLFHYWFGPHHLRLPMYRGEIELLRGATGRGLKIGVVPGNRDFLLDDRFAQVTGVRVFGDGLELRLGGERVHLSHGDLFATADTRYLRMRRVLRLRMVRFLAGYLPGPWVRFVARRLRSHSERVVRGKSAAELEPDRGAVEALIRAGMRTVVCGHFHRRRDEVLTTAEGDGRFIILEPFEDRGFVLTHDGHAWGCRWLAGGDR